MNKKKLIDHSKEVNQVLKIGKLHEEVVQKKQKKKIRIVPVIMIILGTILITVGVFFQDIKKIVDQNNNKKPKVVEKKNKEQTILTCVSKTEKESIGINEKKTTRYEFKNNLLKNIQITLEQTPITNKEDIASENLKVYDGEYQKVIETLTNIPGIMISSKKESNKLTLITKVDFEKIDVKTIPKNDYVIITNTKEDTYRSIKEIEGRAGNICTVK